MGKPRPTEVIELDGRTLEGGGQLIRIALCLSALTGTPIKITDIRGNRSSGGGLKAQHLACVHWLAHACNAKTAGAEKGSTTLVFKPGEVDGLSPAFKQKTLPDGGRVYECRLDIGTAGSTGLALQAILPFILFSRLPQALPVRLTLSGGTNVSGSPSYEYITQVLLPTLHSIGLPAMKAKLGKRGWSQGGSSIGNFTLDIAPRSATILPAFRLRPTQHVRSKPKKPTHLQATFVAPASCHDHFRTVLLPAIHHHFGPSYSTTEGSPPNLTITCEGSLHEKRMYLILVATAPTSNPAHPTTYTLGRDWLYDRKIRGSHERAATEMAERVTNELAEEWLSGGWVDEHMRDQLVIFQALAAGRSEVWGGKGEDKGKEREASLHARTAEWVAERMLGVRFDWSGGCEGVGFGDEGGREQMRAEEGVDERGLVRELGGGLERLQFP
ncbi:hypothetical protein LTR36_006760 [Oleoguttula mirabilis]|uniref:RNA 3'-terminal phosphate cyclase domain-containing protein n=1 Tax=Oleoguttula mirabilis TaxID=1507867 RepID=A0AAV9JBQ6_9PEZI|nr:hypothetical protein LTR36_006760 [Oleoguttula mirabilis]